VNNFRGIKLWGISVLFISFIDAIVKMGILYLFLLCVVLSACESRDASLCDICTCSKGVATCLDQEIYAFPPLSVVDRFVLGTRAIFYASINMRKDNIPKEYSNFFVRFLFSFTPLSQTTASTMNKTTTTASAEATRENWSVWDIVHVIMEFMGYCLSLAGFLFVWRLRVRLFIMWRYIQQRDDIR
jgi:hypothetical protein